MFICVICHVTRVVWPIELVFIINISLLSIDNKRSASMKVFLFLNKQHGRMAQRLARLPPKPKIASSNPSSILFFHFNVSKLLSSLSKYVEADLMDLLLEENASLANIPEELSTLMTVLQT